MLIVSILLSVFLSLEWPRLLLSGPTVPSGTVTPTTTSHKQFLVKEFSFTKKDLQTKNCTKLKLKLDWFCPSKVQICNEFSYLNQSEIYGTRDKLTCVNLCMRSGPNHLALCLSDIIMQNIRLV